MTTPASAAASSRFCTIACWATTVIIARARYGWAGTVTMGPPRRTKEPS
jgi:hypothetical protein